MGFTVGPGWTGQGLVDLRGFRVGPGWGLVDLTGFGWALGGLGGAGRSPAAHMMSSKRFALATQSRARGSDAAMIMHMKGRPVRRSVG